jgi:hypothetical protein
MLMRLATRSALRTMTRVELRITNVASGLGNAQARLGGSILEKDAVVFRSALSTESSISDHLVLLWGILKHERRLLKRFQTAGAEIKVICRTSASDFRILPNAAEMLHLLNAALVIEIKPRNRP